MQNSVSRLSSHQHSARSTVKAETRFESLDAASGECSAGVLTSCLAVLACDVPIWLGQTRCAKCAFCLSSVERRSGPKRKGRREALPLYILAGGEASWRGSLALQFSLFQRSRQPHICKVALQKKIIIIIRKGFVVVYWFGESWWQALIQRSSLQPWAIPLHVVLSMMCIIYLFPGAAECAVSEFSSIGIRGEVYVICTR